MVPIRSLVTFINAIVAEIPAISRVVRIETEGQIKKHTPDMRKDELVLFLVTPSVIDGLLDTDNKGDENTGMFYFLTKVDGSQMNQEEELTLLEKIQNAAAAFRESVYSKRNDSSLPYFARHIEFHQLNPEYSFLGCNGYSWNYSIKD